MTIGPLVPGSATVVTADTAPAYSTTATGPAVDGPVVAIDVLQALEKAVNVQKWAYLIFANGVHRVWLGTYAAMVASIDATNNDTFFATDAGLYHFVDHFTADLPEPWQVQSSGVPSGYWEHAETRNTIGARGLARVGGLGALDPDTGDGKIPVDLQTNRIVYDTYIAGTSQLNELVTTGNATTLDVAQLGALRENDRVMGSIDNVWLACSSTIDQNAKYEVRLVCDVDGTPTTQILATHDQVYHSITGADAYAAPMSFAGLVNRAGNAKLQVRIVAATDANATLYGVDRTTYRFGHFTIYRP